MFRIFALTAVAVLFALATSILSISPASAKPIVVDTDAGGAISDDGLCSLREAIMNAQSGGQVFTSAGECAAGKGASVKITFDLVLPATIFVSPTLPTIVSGVHVNIVGPSPNYSRRGLNLVVSVD